MSRRKLMKLCSIPPVVSRRFVTSGWTTFPSPCPGIMTACTLRPVSTMFGNHLQVPVPTTTTGPTPSTSPPSSSSGKSGNESSPEQNAVAVGASETTGTISKAMQSYMQRAQEFKEFMEKEEKEFVFGRRHLANMMGKDPEGMTQDDINEAIRYLFPSGLFEKKARPMMKPPEEIYPKQKAAQFDISGRPHHPFFYTSYPNFFQLMNEMVGKLNKMSATAGGISVFDGDNMMLAGSTWVTADELRARLMEKITDKQYKEWVSCMERIANHSEREREAAFVHSYRKPLAQQALSTTLPPITLEPDGKKSCYVPVCMKKTARGEVKMTIPGTGRININGQYGLEYFNLMLAREMLLTPLQLCGWLGKVDIDAYVMGADQDKGKGDPRYYDPFLGETARAGALRWGVATAMAALGADMERLRLAGVLVRDNRMHERTKPGKSGPRATWTWKKR